METGFGLGHTRNPQGPSLLPPPQAYERQVPPRAVINSAGYKILTSLDQYLELVGNSLPGKGPPIPGEAPRDLARGEGAPDPGAPGSTSAGRPAGPRASSRCPAQPEPPKGGLRGVFLWPHSELGLPHPSPCFLSLAITAVLGDLSLPCLCPGSLRGFQEKMVQVPHFVNC